VQEYVAGLPLDTRDTVAAALRPDLAALGIEPL
jgi:hypothetical protein